MSPKPEAFGSAALKVHWAKQHVLNMEKSLRGMHERAPNTLFVKNQSQSDQVEVTFDFGPLLEIMRTLQMMAGDAVHNLRSSLDHLAYNIVRAYCEPPNYRYFPIDSELNSLISQSSFRKIEEVAPDIAALIVNEIKPYGAGNPFLAVNHLDRADKHRLLLTHAVRAQTTIYMAKDDDDVPDQAAGSFILVANPTRIPAVGSKAAAHNENHRRMAFDICFDAGLPFEHEPVIPALHHLTQAVAGAVQIVIAHCEKPSP
jgi:hypothetical protein